MLQLSKRSFIRSTAQEFTEEVKKLTAEGKRVIPCHVGQPSTGAPQAAIRAVQHAMQSDILGYTSAYGILELRQRIATHYAHKYNLDINPQRIIVTPGASIGFNLACIGCFDQGARIAIPYPVYAAFLPIIENAGLNIVGFATQLKNRFQPTVEDLEALQGNIDGLLLTHPGNPSGATLSYDELKTLIDYCMDRDIRVISDETYHGVVYEKNFTETSGAQFSEDIVVLNSFSKYYSMPGWRIGWMVAPEALAHNLGNVIRNLYICPAAPSQHAAMAAMDEHQELNEHVKRYAVNRNILLQELPKAGFDKFIRPQGAFYFYTHVQDLQHDAYQFCLDLLHNTAIAAMPGGDFDPIQGRRYVRFSYAGSTEDIEEACHRIRKWRG